MRLVSSICAIVGIKAARLWDDALKDWAVPPEVVGSAPVSPYGFDAGYKHVILGPMLHALAELAQRHDLPCNVSLETPMACGVGICFKGVEKTTVEEYCVSEGWIRVAAGTAKDRFGNPLTIKLNGPVEPYFQDKKEG